MRPEASPPGRRLTQRWQAAVGRLIVACVASLPVAACAGKSAEDPYPQILPIDAVLAEADAAFSGPVPAPTR